MEAKEAIEVLTDKNTSIGTLKCDDTAWRKLKPAIDAAVEALKKQIPIEHHHTKTASMREGARWSVCPICLGVICTGTDEYPRFCTWCGQSIDWEK